MQDSWPAPASVDDLRDAMAAIHSGSLRYVRVSAERSSLEVLLSRLWPPESWDASVLRSDVSTEKHRLPERWRNELLALGWPPTRSRAQDVTRRWRINEPEDVEPLHAALIEVLSVGAAPSDAPVDLELSFGFAGVDTTGYAQIGCVIGALSAVVGMVLGFVVAILTGYPANSLDPGLLAKALAAGLVVGVVAMMLAQPGGEKEPSKARELAFLVVAIALPGLVTLLAVLGLSIWGS